MPRLISGTPYNGYEAVQLQNQSQAGGSPAGTTPYNGYNLYQNADQSSQNLQSLYGMYGQLGQQNQWPFGQPFTPGGGQASAGGQPTQSSWKFPFGQAVTPGGNASNQYPFSLAPFSGLGNFYTPYPTGHAQSVPNQGPMSNFLGDQGGGQGYQSYQPPGNNFMVPKSSTIGSGVTINRHW